VIVILNVFDPHRNTTLKQMSFQSGGAILGTPGAPGAPVRIIMVMPEANPLQRTGENHKHTGTLTP